MKITRVPELSNPLSTGNGFKPARLARRTLPTKPDRVRGTFSGTWCAELASLLAKTIQTLVSQNIGLGTAVEGGCATPKGGVTDVPTPLPIGEVPRRSERTLVVVEPTTGQIRPGSEIVTPLGSSPRGETGYTPVGIVGYGFL